MMEKAIAIYSRKSKFTGKGESIENQIELCKQYIHAHEGKEASDAALVFEDEGFSGKSLERPKFKKMMADAKAGKIRTIVVYRLDRISRNIGDFAALIEELNDRNISFVSIKEQFDTSSPMGRAMMYIASVFSQLERETIAERIRDNMQELSKTGRWLGGVTPTGYASRQIQQTDADGRIHKACMLEIVPKEAEMVRLIFQKFLENQSLTKTDAFLLQSGYRTKNGKTFTRFTIKGILANPVYMTADEDAYQYLIQKGVKLYSREAEFDGSYGIMAYNRTLQKTGKTTKIQPMPEWIVSVGRHQGLISGAKWIKAQEILEQNRSKGYRKPRSHRALLSGILYCGNCGDAMRPKGAGRLDAEGRCVYTYLCRRKERSRGLWCSCKNVNGTKLDQAVIHEIEAFYEEEWDISEFRRQLEKGKQLFANSQDGDGEPIGCLNAQKGEIEKEMKALLSLLGKVSGSAAEDYILKQMEELDDKNKRLNCCIQEMKQTAGSHELSKEEFCQSCQKLVSFSAVIHGAPIEQKRAAVRSSVKKIVWDGSAAHVYWFNTDAEFILPDQR